MGWQLMRIDAVIVEIVREQGPISLPGLCGVLCVDEPGRRWPEQDVRRRTHHLATLDEDSPIKFDEMHRLVLREMD